MDHPLDAMDQPLTVMGAMLELQRAVHTNAKHKGFWEGGADNRSVLEIFALIHSELSEALEALRAGNPPDNKIPLFSGVEAETADVVIRLLDFFGGFEVPALRRLLFAASTGVMRVLGVPGAWRLMEQNITADFFPPRATLADCIAILHSSVSLCCGLYLKHGTTKTTYFENSSASLIRQIVEFSKKFKLDVGGAIEAKTTFNSTREHKHGKVF